MYTCFRRSKRRDRFFSSSVEHLSHARRRTTSVSARTNYKDERTEDAKDGTRHNAAVKSLPLLREAKDLGLGYIRRLEMYRLRQPSLHWLLLETCKYPTVKVVETSKLLIPNNAFRYSLRPVATDWDGRKNCARH
jgi:hypothetical protein